MYCHKCGKKIDDKAIVCPYCGVKQKILDTQPIGCLLGGICFLFPLVGLILYLVWKDDKPTKAKGAGTAALWGFLTGLILSFLGLCSFSYY
ncbi:MAG: zinc ribbon domain-containing protein [Candidatus Cloacimonetes bacterium]|nr:zinc ribbon domain-containing protein [Candidatus Cloacimonadota bacterium]MBS3768498.1 zinc ribbon domain-containing protein [Candidatus Cloacimonadota bacterium]